VASGYLIWMLARRVRTDGFIDPCIPTIAAKPPAGPGWVHEIKHDGYRLIVRRDGSAVRPAATTGPIAIPGSPSPPVKLKKRAIHRFALQSRVGNSRKPPPKRGPVELAGRPTVSEMKMPRVSDPIGPMTLGDMRAERRAVARRVVLAMPPPCNPERGPVARRRAGSNIRAANGVRPDFDQAVAGFEMLQNNRNNPSKGTLGRERMPHGHAINVVERRSTEQGSACLLTKSIIVNLAGTIC
jgi:hypothetical protein